MALSGYKVSTFIDLVNCRTLDNLLIGSALFDNSANDSYDMIGNIVHRRRWATTYRDNDIGLSVIPKHYQYRRYLSFQISDNRTGYFGGFQFLVV